MNESISIVTAFFDIGRGELPQDKGYPIFTHRTTETYFEYFSNLAELENEMIIFTSEEYKNKILKIRKEKPTKIIVIDLNKKFHRQLKKIKEVLENEEFRKKINKDMLLNIEYWSPEYILVTNLKTFFVNYAIRKKLVSNNILSWIDFGYVRDIGTLNNVKNWYYPFDKDKIHFFTIKKNYPLKKIEDVYDIIFNNKVFIIGGAVAGGKEKWKELYKLQKQCQNELLKQNISDDDQGVYFMCLFKSRNLFKLNYLGKDNWFALFRKYDRTSKISLTEKLKDIFV